MWQERAMTEDTMRQMFNAFSTSSGVMQKNARIFWEGQDGFLDEMQAFWNGWFERRHAGTRAALEASERMLKASTPTEWLGEYQRWLTGSFERIMADAAACQKELRNVGEGLRASLVPSTDQDDNVVVQEKAKKRAPAEASR
jgi:hypothetical protein